MKKTLQLLFTVLITGSATFTAFAQKTEDVQSTNLLVSKIKVDGKLNDWEAPLKATNKSTRINYTIGNDNKNLYLAIQATDVESNRKILAGGITFTINTENKKKTKDAFSLTYPLNNRNNRRPGGNGGTIVMGGQRGGGGGGGTFSAVTVGDGGGRGPNRPTATPEETKRRDSLQMVQMKKQLTEAKDIKLFGFKNVTDSLISIYNEYSIKAMASVDEKGRITIEYAIPLEQLGLTATSTKEFSYNIKVNGMQLGGGGGGGVISIVASDGGGGGRGFDMQDMMNATDLWGKYILAQ